MKKLILAAALSVAPVLAMADEMCDGMSSYSETVMRARQAGVSMQEMMAIVNKNLDSDSSMWRIYKAIIIDAYSQPRYNSTEYKENAIRDFSNDMYLFCIKVRSE